MGFPGGLMVKNLPAMQETWVGTIHGLGRSPGEGNGNPLQYSCLENPMDRGDWRTTVHGVAESDVTEWLTFPLAFIYSPTEDYLSCFQVLAIMNKHQCAGFCVDISFQLFQVEFSFKIRNSQINVDKFNFFTSIYTLDFKNKSFNSHWENTFGPLKSLLFVIVRARMHEVF